MSEHDLPPDILQLLESEKARPGPSGEVAARLSARLFAAIGGGAPGGGGDTGGATGSAAAPVAGSSLVKSLVIGATSLAVGAAGGIAIDRAVVREPEVRVVYVDRAVVRSATAVASVAPPATSEAVAIAPSDLPRAEEPRRVVVSGHPLASAAPAPSASEAPGAARDRAFAAERALIEMARTALGRGDAAAALAALDKHAATYPRGVFGEEREALAIQALARLGRMGEARARAAQFRRLFANSLFLPVVDSAVGAP